MNEGFNLRCQATHNEERCQLDSGHSGLHEVRNLFTHALIAQWSDARHEIPDLDEKLEEPCGAWIIEEGQHGRTHCDFPFGHDGQHSYQPVIEPTDAFCEHGNPAEVACMSCAAASIEAEVLGKAINDFRQMSTAFKNLAIAVGNAVRGMNEAMVRFENEHGENLRVLLHEAQQRQLEVSSFGQRTAGDSPDK